MFKQKRAKRGVAAAGLFCLFGHGCGPRSVQPAHPQSVTLGETKPKADPSSYRSVSSKQISEYLETMYRTSEGDRIRAVEDGPVAIMSAQVRELADRAAEGPNNLKVQKELARALIKEGELVKAFETLDRLRTMPAVDPEIESGLALVWEKMGSTSSALYHARQAVHLDRAPANLALLGKIYLQRGEYERSLEALKEAHRAYPDRLSLLLALAQASLGAEQWKLAQSYGKRALELNPTSTPARELLATALVRIGESDGALAHLRHGLPAGEAYARLGEELMAAEQWAEAHRALKKALQYLPGNEDLALQLSVVASRLPIPVVVSLGPGDGTTVDIQSVPSLSTYAIIELKAGQIRISGPTDPSRGADSPSAIPSSVSVSLSSTDETAEPGPNPAESRKPTYVQRVLAPGVVELVELPAGLGGSVGQLADSGTVSKPFGSIDSEPVAAATRQEVSGDLGENPGVAQLAQLPLHRNLQVIQLVQGRDSTAPDPAAALTEAAPGTPHTVAGDYDERGELSLVPVFKETVHSPQTTEETFAVVDRGGLGVHTGRKDRARRRECVHRPGRSAGPASVTYAYACYAGSGTLRSERLAGKRQRDIRRGGINSFGKRGNKSAVAKRGCCEESIAGPRCSAAGCCPGLARGSGAAAPSSSG